VTLGNVRDVEVCFFLFGPADVEDIAANGCFFSLSESMIKPSSIGLISVGLSFDL